MQLLNKTTLLNAIDAALIVNHEIEVIDWATIDRYVVDDYNYDGISILGLSRIEIHYSIFHKIFPHVFKLSTMTFFEQNMWKVLMAICLIKQYKLTINSSKDNDFCTVIEIESGH